MLKSARPPHKNVALNPPLIRTDRYMIVQTWGFRIYIIQIFLQREFDREENRVLRISSI